VRRGAAAAAVLAALALSGCETTQEKSAKLARVAKLREAGEAKHAKQQQHLLTIARVSRKVSVAGVVLLRSSEGLAAVVTLENHSSTAVREAPVRINVRDQHGRSLFTNEAAGQAPPLVSASLIPAHGRFDWIDDQVPLNNGASSVTAQVGEAPTSDGAVPKLTVTGAHMTEDPTSGPGAEGEVVNHSAVSQRELVVYAVVRRGGKVVAAGRAIVPEAPAGASTRFQLFFIGDARGGTLEVEAPPSTLG
jgi:hypothetical protein